MESRKLLELERRMVDGGLSGASQAETSIAGVQRILVVVEVLSVKREQVIGNIEYSCTKVNSSCSSLEQGGGNVGHYRLVRSDKCMPVRS